MKIRFLLILVGDVYCCSGLFNSDKLPGMGTRLNPGGFFRFNRKISGRFRLKSSGFFQFRLIKQKSNACRFLNSYALKLYETSALKNSLGVKFCIEVWSLLKKQRQNKIPQRVSKILEIKVSGYHG